MIAWYLYLAGFVVTWYLLQIAKASEILRGKLQSELVVSSRLILAVVCALWPLLPVYFFFLDTFGGHDE